VIAGEVPMKLTRADVWALMKERFNANEIAYLAGVTVSVALGMMNEAVPRATRNRKVLTCRRAA
jgi:hypothetical protein